MAFSVQRTLIAIEIPGEIRGFDRDCFVASLLAMTGEGYRNDKRCICHCEERSDEAISKPQIFSEVYKLKADG